MDHEKEYFLPENHEHGTHHTYTGKGCAVCGKDEPGHMPKREKPKQENKAVSSKD
jgi:hypothetical protein